MQPQEIALWTVALTSITSLVLGLFTQYTNHRNQSVQQSGAIGAKQIDDNASLRRELMEYAAKSRQEELRLQGLIEDRDRRMIRLLNWVWRLSDELKAHGIEVHIPPDLTLEGFDRPEIAHPPIVPGPDNPTPSTPTPTPPGVRPQGIH